MLFRRRRCAGAGRRNGETMKITIHRGQNQIGGNIIEIAAGKTRLFFDVGVNLDDSAGDAFPPVEGLFAGEKNCGGVLISHYHSDHMGLLGKILPGIPVYMGEKAYKVFEAAASWRGQEPGFQPRFFEAEKRFEIGGIAVTPFLCDHSSFDSYMFLVEAEGRRVLYTGDFRANGRPDFDALLEKLPCVDCLITEGTTLRRDTQTANLEEVQLEEIAVNYLAKHVGPAFILMSAMNVERVMTAYHMAQKTGRIFLEDIYTANVAAAAGTPAPEPGKDPGIRVFTTGGDRQYQQLQKYEHVKIGREAIAKTPFVMCVRASMKKYLNKLSEQMSFEDGVLFYGMWKGYMEQPAMKEFLDFMEEKGVRLHILHTSGHADAVTIDRLIRTVRPGMIIPVHTENAQWFARYSPEHTVMSEVNEVEI